MNNNMLCGLSIQLLNQNFIYLVNIKSLLKLNL